MHQSGSLIPAPLETMPAVEHSVDILREVEDVFEYASNPSKWPEWGTVFERVAAPTGGVREGSTFRASAKFLGRGIDTTFEVQEVRPPHRFRYHAVDGPVRGRFDWRFDPVDLGTRFTFVVEVEGGGLSKLAGSVVLGAATRQITEDLERLKRRLEAPETGDV